MASESPRPNRLASLDVLRGLTLIGMVLVNYADELKEAGLRVFPLLLHVPWAGFHIADSVFPAFLLMSGVSIPLAGNQMGLTPQALRRLAVRTLRLILIGLVISNTGWLLSPLTETFRPLGVLQRIGVAYFVAAVLFYVTGPRTRIAIAAGLLLVYWPLTLLPCPDGVATHLLQPGANFSSWIDRAVFGVHVYVPGPLGFDPEGLLGMLPAIAQALIGVAVGQWVMARRSAGLLAVAGAAMIAAGLAWSPLFPIVKALWSSSFVLLSSGVAVLVLSALYALMDLRGARLPGAGVLTDFGVNSIFAYCLHNCVSGLLHAPILRATYDAATPTLGAPVAALIPSLVVLALMGLILRYMRARNWIVKV